MADTPSSSSLSSVLFLVSAAFSFLEKKAMGLPTSCTLLLEHPAYVVVTGINS